MRMDFVRKVMDSVSASTNYKLAKLLGVSVQLVDGWTGKDKNRKSPAGMQLKYLVKLRAVSGMSWQTFGRLLDSEFLEVKK